MHEQTTALFPSNTRIQELHAWHTHDEYTQGRKFHVSDIQTSLIYELKVSIQFYEDAEHIRRKKPTTIEVIGFYLMNLSVEGPTM